MSISDSGEPASSPAVSSREDAALRDVMRKSARFIAMRARYVSGGDDRVRDELVSAGMAGMLEAVRKHDPTVGVPLEALAIKHAKWRMADVARREQAEAQSFVGLRHETGDDDDVDVLASAPSQFDGLLAEEFETRVGRFVSTLTPRQKEVFNGLRKSGGVQADVARQLRVSRTAISKTVATIREKITTYRLFDRDQSAA